MEILIKLWQPPFDCETSWFASKIVFTGPHCVWRDSPLVPPLSFFVFLPLSLFANKNCLFAPRDAMYGLKLWRPDVGNILFLKYTIIVLMVVYHLSITAIDYSIVFQAPTYVRNWQRLNCPRWTPSQYHRPWVNICLNHSKSLMDTISVSQIKGWT